MDVFQCWQYQDTFTLQVNTLFCNIFAIILTRQITYILLLILSFIAGNRFPGAEDIPDGLAAFPALAATKDGQGALIAMVSTMLLLEICMRDADWSDTTPEFPGDYRNGVNGFGKKAWDNYTPEQKLKKRTIELNNGRAGKFSAFHHQKCS